ncbi:MAG: hypothetical protein GFH27_549283n424 [Chloroflexi bacterium AL-W]|nr:hypothetical protein [Chloroflexi bacterium AL-N1]NOK64455.1 hypothetical protein [Chloroflexi bacterium AL-N10]NOK75697.1 hypothetical protein [Chloroflexi bacterium AL-N5]NOK80545.1 hypothetical protein [Chloroflexi bacterium AL-W]NOK87059.1 hypothetical protein [Chloroflexi bacterium AL-N15]
MNDLIGLVTDLSTRLAQVERLLERQNTLETPIAGSGGSESGTSFPSSPADGDRFWRKDRGIEYAYNNDSSLWLSTYEFPIYFLISDFSDLTFTSTTQTARIAPIRTDYDVYLTSAAHRLVVGSPNNSSNYWRVTYTYDGATYWEYDTSDSGAGIVVKSTTAFVLNPVAAAVSVIGMNLIKVGSPGLIRVRIPLFFGRLVG